MTSTLEPALCLPIVFILYRITGRCWWPVLAAAHSGIPLTSTLGSVLTGHAITPLQDLSKHVLEGLPVDASLGFWSCPHICLLHCLTLSSTAGSGLETPDPPGSDGSGGR